MIFFEVFLGDISWELEGLHTLLSLAREGGIGSGGKGSV
jgi:hypothetical protein